MVASHYSSPLIEFNRNFPQGHLCHGKDIKQSKRFSLHCPRRLESSFLPAKKMQWESPLSWWDVIEWLVDLDLATSLSPLGTSGRNSECSEKEPNACFPSQLKSPVLGTFLPKLLFPHALSVICGQGVCAGGGHLSPFYISEIIEVIWNKQTRNRRYLYLWQVSLLTLSMLFLPSWDKPPVLNTALQEVTISPSGMTFYMVFMDNLMLKAMVSNGEGLIGPSPLT